MLEYTCTNTLDLYWEVKPMSTPKIFESEYRFCLILWEHEPIKSTRVVIMLPRIAYRVYPKVYFSSASRLLLRSRKNDTPILSASPRSWTASECIALLPLMMPPKNSKTEKMRFRRKAIKILRFVFITLDTLHESMIQYVRYRTLCSVLV